MRNWEAYAGALWMAVATLLASAALQPVEISAASARPELHMASLRAQGGNALATGCDSLRS